MLSTTSITQATEGEVVRRVASFKLKTWQNALVSARKDVDALAFFGQSPQALTEARALVAKCEAAIERLESLINHCPITGPAKSTPREPGRRENRHRGPAGEGLGNRLNKEKDDVFFSYCRKRFWIQGSNL